MFIFENQLRVLSLYKVYGDSALLVLNGTSLNSDSALLALTDDMFGKALAQMMSIIYIIFLIFSFNRNLSRCVKRMCLKAETKVIVFNDLIIFTKSSFSG